MPLLEVTSDGSCVSQELKEGFIKPSTYLITIYDKYTDSAQLIFNFTFN